MEGDLGSVDFPGLARLLSEAPARLTGLADRKGRLQKGFDADIWWVWEPHSAANTSTALNRHRHRLSPYTDLPLKGKVVATVVGGELTALFGKINTKPCGSLVLRRRGP
ncbi:putative allantoinase 1 [Tetrabaena socialis]|uniref:Putative allantoinase 1 n=1 Tax=Tetrabaena socialis TaxID=47790 RepID=A0A2J8AFG5_9CHLO|nr:putative allantoinase 1 [Tetrabaena socialis]|eukprot:PNH11261.1 putative allantoinase 1 [Tetrabaena socialis]